MDLPGGLVNFSSKEKIDDNLGEAGVNGHESAHLAEARVSGGAAASPHLGAAVEEMWEFREFVSHEEVIRPRLRPAWACAFPWRIG